MTADFWAGYASGAAAIVIGNPLDLVKTRLQASSPPSPAPAPLSASSLLRGAPAPLLTYGALNAVLFATYTRSLALLSPSPSPAHPHPPPPLAAVFAAGAAGGLASFVVGCPAEVVKCRAMVSAAAAAAEPGTRAAAPPSSLRVALALVRARGWRRGMYLGGGVTAWRDAAGYGVYFWAYEAAKRSMLEAAGAGGDVDGAVGVQDDPPHVVLLAGGLAGVATWTSVFPLDVLKTRLQILPLHPDPSAHPSAAALARRMWTVEGPLAFWRGYTACALRAFVVNAAQWWVYERVFAWMSGRGW